MTIDGSTEGKTQMRFGPRKIVAIVGLVGLAVVLAVLVALDVLDVTGAAILVVVAAVGILVAFVDIRQARRLARSEQRLAARLDAARARTDRVGDDLARRLEQEDRTSPLPHEATRKLVERALRDSEARQTRTLHARTERLETAYDQQRRSLEQRMDALGSRWEQQNRALARQVAKLERQVHELTDPRGRDPAHTRRLLQASVALHQELAGHVALPQASTWAAGADLLLFLYRLTAALQPRRVLECGSGVSTAVMARALATDEQEVVTLEADAAFVAKTRTWAASMDASDRVRVVDAPLVDTVVDGETFQWYDLAGLPDGAPAQLLVVDGPWGGLQARSRLPALSCLRDHLADDVVVVLDDADRDDEVSIIARWRELLPDHELATIEHAKGTAVLAPTGSIALRLE